MCVCARCMVHHNCVSKAANPKVTVEETLMSVFQTGVDWFTCGGGVMALVRDDTLLLAGSFLIQGIGMSELQNREPES